MDETVKDAPVENEELAKAKRAEKVEHILEIVVVIMLGITALFTAWASWVGSLHGGNQAGNYTSSNNLASEGNSEYNAGVQSMNQDMLLWNEISDLQIDILFAQDNNDQAAVTQSANKLFFKLQDNLSEAMATAIGWSFDYASDDPEAIVLEWMAKDEAMASPFTDEAFVSSYFVRANELLAQSDAAMAQGSKDNTDGDAYGLVTVIYGVVLFLLGIAGSFKGTRNKYAIIAVSILGFVIATVYMFTIPMPTGFNITGFFGM
jgi:uncharacterized membrane protein YkgB